MGLLFVGYSHYSLLYFLLINVFVATWKPKTTFMECQDYWYTIPMGNCKKNAPAMHNIVFCLVVEYKIQWLCQIFFSLCSHTAVIHSGAMLFVAGLV